MSPLSKLVTPAVLVATLGLALSACGVAGAGTGVHPGVAASINGDSLSSSDVDAAATSFCSALSSGAFGQVGAVSRSELRQGVAGNLLRQTAASQFAAEQGVTIGPYYDTVRAQAADSLPDGLSEDQRDALVEVQSADTYVSEVALAVGEKDLGDGATPSAKIPPDAAKARGAELFAQWLADQDVSIDPSVGIALGPDGSWAPADTTTSVALSSTARLAASDAVGADGKPDPTHTAYVQSLPASQRCGS